MRLGRLKPSQRRFALLTAALTVLQGAAGSIAWARQDIIPGSRYTSARGASMGDAYNPIGDDGASALFYNPALISKLRSPDLDVMNLQFYGSSSLASGAGTDTLKVFNLQSSSASLAKKQGTYMGAGAQLTPTYSMRGFALGVMANSQFGAVKNSDGGTRYRSLYQIVPAVGFGTRFAKGIIRVGYTLQWVNQASGDITTTNPTSYSSGLSQGSAFSHNLGASMQLPVAYLPAINVVARNVATAKYKSGGLVKIAQNSPGAPTDEPMSIDVSLSFEPKATQRSSFNLVTEYRDATNQSGVSSLGHLALGAEYQVRNFLFLRAGYGTGYPTAGLGIRTKRGEISLGWVAEDIGTTYHERIDRRYMFQYTVRAF